MSVTAQHAVQAGEDFGSTVELPTLAVHGVTSSTTSFTGMGGNAPAPGVLPLPEVLPPPPQDELADDLSSLAKGERIADERAAAEERKRARAEAPVLGTITSSFGPRWGSTHYGLDVANEIGTPIIAPKDGEIIDSGPASGFGLWVRIRHDDGTITVYGHINESLVSVGQRVSRGEQIATVGNRGQSTGPHLHFEVLEDDGKVDPLDWLQSNGADI